MPEYFYRGVAGTPDEEESDPPLPTSSDEQLCAICGSDQPAWVHALDPSRVAFRKWGKGHTLPTFWCLCDDCESAYQGGSDETLVQTMAERSRRSGRHEHGRVDDYDAVEEDFRTPLATFRRADLYRQALR